MESLDSKSRPLGQKMVLTETDVNLNESQSVKCDSVVDAKKLYWSKCKVIWSFYQNQSKYQELDSFQIS